MSKTSKANVAYLKKCRERVEASRKWRQREGYDDLWSRLIQVYAGHHFDYDSMGDEDRITVNISFASVNVIYPSVSVANPKFVVAALTPESEHTSIIAEAVLNHDWRRYRYQPEFRRAVKDFIIIGHGWGKTGYRFAEREQARPDGEVQAEAEQRYAEVNDAIAADPSMAEMMPTAEEIEASIPQTHVVVAEDRSFMERVSPFDMFVDPTATSMNDLRWLAQRIIVPLETAKNDKRFIAATRSKLTSTTTASSSNSNEDAVTRRFRGENSDEQYTTLWEYYDLDGGQMCIFADGCDGYLVNPMTMPYAFGHPFEMLRNYDVPDFFYPMGDLENVEQLQQELNLTRSQTMNDRKRWRRKYLVNEDAFDKDGMNALESVEENVLVPVRKGVPFGEAVTPLPFTPLPPEFYNMSETVKSDMNEVMAISEYARGSLPDIKRTATEAAVISDAANARAAEKLILVEEMLGNLGLKLIQLAQQYMTGQQIVHVVGQGGELWAHYDRTYIAGEFDFQVEAGSTQPNNESIRRQSAMQLMDAMSQFIPMGVVNVPELMTYVLQKGFGIKSPERFIQQPPPPPPMAPQGPPPQGELPPGPPPPPEPPMPPPEGTGEQGFGNQFVSQPDMTLTGQ